MTRRDFVRWAVGGAAVGGAGVLGVRSYLDSRIGWNVPYYGARVVGGPAPKGLPLVPVRRRDDGVLEGVPDQMHAYRYCQLEGAPGLRDDYAGDNVLRYYETPGWLEAAEDDATPLWYRDRIGEPVHAADFPGVGAGAAVRWRSDGQFDRMVIRMSVIRVEPDAYPAAVRDRFVPDGFVGMLAHCTHFCCVAGWQNSDAIRDYPVSDGRDAWETVFCVCHGAAFDPYDVRIYRTPADQPARNPGRPVPG